jgi:hypothetical protein
LTNKDEEKVKQEIEGFKKINKDSSTDITTRLKHQIVSVDNNNDKNSIKDFVDNYLLASDSRSFRAYIKEISPDINLTYKLNVNGVEEDIDIPISLNFFLALIIETLKSPASSQKLKCDNRVSQIFVALVPNL